MVLKLAALGALGYAGYKYLEKSNATRRSNGDGNKIAVAGGPLSEQASVQHSAELPPGA